VVTGCHVNGCVDAWRLSRKVLHTCTDPIAAGVSTVGLAAAQAGIPFTIVRPAAVTDAALRNPLRERFAMSALSLSSPVDVTQVSTNPNTLQE
jgi:hypothetical protein